MINSSRNIARDVKKNSQKFNNIVLELGPELIFWADILNKLCALSPYIFINLIQFYQRSQTHTLSPSTRQVATL
jgi:hypothetical protein